MFGLFKKTPEKPNSSVVKQALRTQQDHLVEAVLISGVVLPPYPVILEKIDRLLSRDDYSLSELARLIEGDAGLTSALMRIANSPVFGVSKTVANIEQAFSILGISRIQTILRSELLRNALKDYGSPALLTQLWSRYSKIAELATTLVSHSNLLKGKTDLVYMIGMFHGAGSFILLKRHPLVTSSHIKPNGDFELQMTQLNEALNTDHAIIGGMVAKSWRLPIVVSDAIAKQRDHTNFDGLTGILIQFLQATILLHDNKLMNEESKPLLSYLTERLGIEQSVIEALAKCSK